MTNFKQPLPLPSPIHYELILQLLERQTMFAVSQTPELRDKVQQLIVSMRKAVALQKQIEQICEQTKLPTDYRWALNHVASRSPEPVCEVKSDLDNKNSDRLQ